MNDLLRIYVLWHPESAAGQRMADAIAKHFDGLGMERDGVAYRVPVRFRSEPWDSSSGSATPREILWDDAEHNAIVLLHDEFTMRDVSMWDAYVRTARDAMGRRKNADISTSLFCARPSAAACHPTPRANTRGSTAGPPPCLTGPPGRNGCCCTRCNVFERSRGASRTRMPTASPCS